MFATLNIKLAKTLWFNTYRGQVKDHAGNYVATLRLIPSIPLDRDELPPDAPEVASYITVIVEDGDFATAELVQFESSVAELLLEQMAQPPFAPEYCQFSYPSPPWLMNKLSEQQQ